MSKGLFNLNNYEWWRNHRRFITLGIFLGLFAYYIRIPTANEFKVRDTCGKLNSSYQITGKKALKNLIGFFFFLKKLLYEKLEQEVLLHHLVKYHFYENRK